MDFRARGQVVINAILITIVVIFLYAVFFHTPEPNYYEKIYQDRYLEQSDRFNKALEFLRQKNYSDAEKTTIFDFPFNGVVHRTELDRKEASVFYFAKFMMIEDNDPINKYLNLQSVRPIEEVVTQEELNKLMDEWKLKSDEANLYVAKQKSEALQGLTEEEKSFVEWYILESVNGKTPDPGVVATHSTSNLTATEATKKAEKWMEDSRILKAIKKYKAISYKYPPN